MPRTLFDKIWDDHIVAAPAGQPALLYIDLHLVHEVTSPQAFDGLRANGRSLRQPARTFATVDHNVPTTSRTLPIADPVAALQVETLRRNCREFGVRLFDLNSDNQGIVHVIGPELGLTQPGMTIVCGDSHTSTHGAFGALAFGIGTSEVGHVLATQCLLQRRPKTLLVKVDGRLSPGVTAKDLILAIIARLGVGGGTGFAAEYAGAAVRALSMDERMTVSNMSIEMGARTGMIAPDDATFQYLAGRPRAPSGKAWDAALARWRALSTDEGARFDREVALDAAALEPMITWGTNPAQGIPVTGRVPDPAQAPDAATRATMENALRYMGLSPGKAILGQPVDVVFIGSCTNGRLNDLRDAARIMKGRKVKLRTLVVPGSADVKRQAEAEGLDRVFREAGAEWREPGCSMCIAMNGDHLERGQYCVATSNRNFEGRQGAGGRTMLASPATAAAAAVTGQVADPRRLEGV